MFFANKTIKMLNNVHEKGKPTTTTTKQIVVTKTKMKVKLFRLKYKHTHEFTQPCIFINLNKHPPAQSMNIHTYKNGQ